MASVDFYADTTLIASDTTEPYSASWSASSAGTYTLTAVAHDAGGNSTTSSGISVTIGSNSPPTVSLTSPASGATFTAPATISLAATASDPEGRMARVEFFSGTTRLATDTTSPYSYSWSGVAAGAYSLTAVAFDAEGNSTTSSAVTVTVNSNSPPTVSLTSPASGATYTAPATINLAATASDPEGRMARVEFFSGTTRLATDTTSPYSYSWSGVAAGTYSLSAVAFDAEGNSTTSSSVSVTVNALPPPRWVVFTASPDHNTLVTSYLFEVFASGANPETATPLATSDLGKPAPDASNEITVDRAAFFNALAPGTYVATVSAIGTGGRGRSASVTFTR
jgi:hypothetical protein